MKHEGDPVPQDGVQTGTAWEMPSSAPLSWDRDRCIGCNRCVDICQVDVMLPSPCKGETPVAAFPGECWYCGCCVTACPVPGAIRLRHPLMNEVQWVDKASLTSAAIPSPTPPLEVADVGNGSRSNTESEAQS